MSSNISWSANANYEQLADNASTAKPKVKKKPAKNVEPNKLSSSSDVKQSIGSLVKVLTTLSVLNETMPNKSLYDSIVYLEGSIKSLELIED